MWIVLAVACGEPAAPGAPAAPGEARSAPAPGDAIDARLLAQIEAAPEAALAALDAVPGEPSPSTRVLRELARWTQRERPPAFAAHLREAGVDPADPTIAAALRRVVGAAVDARTSGVAVTAYAACLDGVPEGAPIDPALRALALRLHELLLDIDAGDLAERVASRTLSRDPEHEQLARRHMDTLLGDEQVAFLREHAARAPAPAWVPALARELDQTATRGDLEDPATREQIARAMSELGGVPPDEARSRLLAALRSLDEPAEP